MFKMLFWAVVLGYCLLPLQAVNLVGMEYFINHYPNSNEEVYAPVDTLAEISEALVIDLSALPPGMHRISMRVKDSQGTWSQFAHRLCYKFPTFGQTLTSMGYYFDDNHSASQSVALSDLGEGIWALDSNLTIPDGFAAGMHILHVWANDSAGKRSQYANRLFTYAPVQTHTINRFAWSFTGSGTDPETVYYHSPQTPLQDITEEFLLALPNLTPGESYYMYFWAIDEEGKTSHKVRYSFVYSFTVENITLNFNGTVLVLSWDEVPNVLHYLVEKKPSPDAAGTEVQTSNNYLEIQPLAQKEFYRVKAVRE